VAKRKSEGITRRSFLGVSVGAAVVAGVGCGTSDKNSQQNSAGQPGSGGTGMNGGASTSSGGASTSVGGAGTNGGTGTSAGGTTAENGGASTGGTTAENGGASTGGTTAANGGASTGGATKANGGTSAGGATKASGGTSAKASASTAKGGATATGGTTSMGGSVSSGGTSNAAGTSGTSPTGSKLVGIVRNTDLVKATKDAIAAAGGLPNLTGRTVLIKPNLVGSTASPCTPNPEVVRGVIQAVKAAGATKILIGDSPASGTAVSVMASVGIHAVNQAEGGVTEVNFTTTTLVPQPTGAAKWTSGINVYKDLLDDGTGNKPYIINMGVCKHHGTAVWSMAMKNWYGIVPSADRKHVNNGMATQPQIAEIHLAVKEDFVILDATKSYITQGPTSGTVASPGIVVASADAVAAEATGLAILRQYRSAGGIAKDDIENMKIFNTDAKTLMGRALTLGNGWITSRAQYTYSASGLGADEATIIAQLDA
jgi:uncharacterized protein (DUF362 family)